MLVLSSVFMSSTLRWGGGTLLPLSLDIVSHLDFLYDLLPAPQKYEENPSIQFGSPAPRGVIYPQSSVEIPVFLLAKATGTLQHSLRIAVFGSCQPPLVRKFQFKCYVVVRY